MSGRITEKSQNSTLDAGQASLSMQQHIIRRTVIKLLIPFIQLFGLYVIAHGKLGPGGGFQGGVILGVSVILFILVFGLKEGSRRVTTNARDFLVSAGVLIFGVIGLFSLPLGGKYLQYGVLFDDPKTGNYFGILGVEIGIGITVAAVMITLFCEIIRRDDDD